MTRYVLELRALPGGDDPLDYPALLGVNRLVQTFEVDDPGPNPMASLAVAVEIYSRGLVQDLGRLAGRNRWVDEQYGAPLRREGPTDPRFDREPGGFVTRQILREALEAAPLFPYQRGVAARWMPEYPADSPQDPPPLSTHTTW